MMDELHIPIHRAIDKEAIRLRTQHVGVKGLDIEKAEELGLFNRISNLLCAMHLLVQASHSLYGQVDYLFALAHVKKHEIKRACMEFEAAYDRWFKFWRSYQTADGVQEMNNELEDLVEQYMRWAGLPVRWQLGQRQDAVSEREPLIELDFNDRLYRLYRAVAEAEPIEDEETGHEEWAVFRSDTPNGRGAMTCVERGVDKAYVQMVAKRMSADDPKQLYAASKIEVVKERRVEVIPYKAYLAGEMIGDVKSVVKKEKTKKSNKEENKTDGHRNGD